LVITGIWSGQGRWRFLLLAILMLGTAVRFYQLTYHSLDLDESFCMFWTSQPILAIIRTLLKPSTQVNPPFYFVVLKGWIALFGDGEVALRTFSALLSVLYLGLLFRLGEQLFSRRTALIAVAIAALNPFLVWFAQEVRMYALGTLLSLAGMIAFVRGLTDGRLRDWAGYALYTLLASYTHIGAALLIPAQALMLLWAWPRNRRAFACGAVALAVITIGYLPYAYNAWVYSGRQIAVLTRYRLPPLTLARVSAERLAVNNAPLAGTAQWAVLSVACFLLGLGLLHGDATSQSVAGAGLQGSRRLSGLAARAFTALHLFVPLALICILSLRHPLFQTKILVFVSAPFAFGLATGTAWLSRRVPHLGWAALAVVLAIELAGLRYNWYPGYEKENWREAARYVEAHSGPEDVVLVHLEYYHVPFEYYYRGPAPVTHPFGSHIEGFDQIDETLQSYSRYDALWLVLSGEFLADPEHYVERWVAERYPLITAVYPKAIAVKGYALRYRLAEPPAKMIPVGAVFGGQVRLVGYRVDQTRLRATDVWLHPPSNWIHVALYWQALGPVGEDFGVLARMTDELGQVWGAQLDRDNDVLHMYPPTRWQSGEVVRTDHDINLNPVTPPGHYQIEISVVHPGSEQRWSADGPGATSDRVVLTRVEITR